MKKNIYILVVLFILIGYAGYAQTITTVGGTGTAGYSGDGGQATSATLNGPVSVTTDNAGNKYIADYSNNVIRKISTSGIISTVAGNGSIGNSGDGGQATSAKLGNPVSVVFDAAGNMYIADQVNNIIRKVTTDGIISTIIGTYSSGGYSGDGGQATAAQLYYPTGLAFDAVGNLYITDLFNHVVRKVNMSTGIITTIAGIGQTNGYSGDGGPATAATLYRPDGIDIDAQGNIYFAEQGNNIIRKINTSGIISTIAGTGNNEYTGDGGPATLATLNIPSGVTIDGAGNIYIADAGNYVIRQVNTAGIISTIAGNGTAGYSGDGGAATSAQLNLTVSVRISIDEADNLYLSDYGNNVIRDIQLPSSSGGSGSVGGTTTTGSGGGFVTVSPSTVAVCAGTGVSLTAGGASTYTWTPATGLSSTNSATVTANPGTTTTYTVSGTNGSGTVGSKTVTVTVNALPIITTSPNNPTVLGGQGAVITASGASTYTWSPSTNLNTITGATVTANPQITKSYTVTGTSSAGCVSSSAVSVAVELFQQTADTLNAPIYYGGRLGIGTTNPQAALDVTGNSNISGVLTSSNIKIGSFSGVSGGGFVTVDSLGNLKINPINNNTVTACGTTSPWMIGGNMLGTAGGTLGTCNGHDLIMKANGTNYMWLKTNGRLGIGTSSPTAKLDVIVSDTNTAVLNVGNGNYSNILNVAANGNVGIGNNTPVAQLDVFVFGRNAAFNINGNGTGSIFNVANDGSLTVGGNTLLNGSLTIPAIKNTATGVSYSSVLVDNTGKLVSGASVAGATGSSWVLGGNANTGSNNIFGTTDNTDLVLAAGNAGTPGVGANRVRIDNASGNIGIGPDFFIGKNPTALLDLGINSIHGTNTPSPIAIRDFNLSTTHAWNNTLFEVDRLGNIYMGTTRPSNSTYTGALLTVSGTMVVKEIYVATTDASWADYVFKKDYKLMPLKEVEKYISTNQHLPNVPSAAEVETKGQNLGALQIKQMEKTEELYLYIIEMNKKLEKLEEQNKKLADEVSSLKKNKQ